MKQIKTVNITDRDMIRCRCGGDLVLIDPASPENAFIDCQKCEDSWFVFQIANDQGVEPGYLLDMLQEGE